MAVIQISTGSSICPFSKKLVKPSNIICIFTISQFIAFKQQLYAQFYMLSHDLVDIIIKKTGYNKLINRFGHERFVRWTVYTKTESRMRRRLIYNYKHDLDDEASKNADADIDTDIDYNSDYLYDNYINNYINNPDSDSDSDTGEPR